MWEISIEEGGKDVLGNYEDFLKMSLEFVDYSELRYLNLRGFMKYCE